MSSRTKFKTNITAPVLKLLSNTVVTNVENPLINKEFKEEVIAGRHSSSVPLKEPVPAPVAVKKTEPAIQEVTINIISELVRDLLPEAISRFRCCSCDKCRAEMTIQALNSLTPKYVNIKNDADLKKLERIKEENKQLVIKALVPIVLKNKNQPGH